jgi:Transposase DDE domain
LTPPKPPQIIDRQNSLEDRFRWLTNCLSSHRWWASDSRNFETLLDIGPDINPRAALGDKGYDSKSNRVAARQRGICPAIPYRSNTKDMPAFFPKTLYKARARIEQAVGKLKRFKRIALRSEKTAQITARSSRLLSALS